jgi:hypothetical protein
MSLNHQLEIMEGTILQNLQDTHKANFVRDTDPESKCNKFTGADLVFAIQAYLQQDHLLSKNKTTESLFDDIKNEDVADDKIDIACKAIALITNKLNPIVQQFYEDTEELKYINILSNSASTFLVPMMASIGVFVERNDDDQDLAIACISRLIDLFKKNRDVFDLASFYGILDRITSSRSTTIKNLVERAFRNFWFDKTAIKLDWEYAYKAERK